MTGLRSLRLRGASCGSSWKKKKAFDSTSRFFFSEILQRGPGGRCPPGRPPPEAAKPFQRNMADQPSGRMTLSMTWMTPFEVSMSAETTVASSTITPLSRSIMTSEPCTVVAIMSSVRSPDITLPGTT